MYRVTLMETNRLFLKKVNNFSGALAREARLRSTIGKKRGKLPIRENLVITWPHTDRPPDRTSAPQAYQCLLSHFLALLGAQEKLIAHQCVAINWELSKQGIRWPVSPGRIVGFAVDPSWSSIFWRYPLQVISFQRIAGSTWSLFFKIHMNCVVFMSLWPSTINILISNWPRTRKFSQLFKNASREDRCFSFFSP